MIIRRATLQDSPFIAEYLLLAMKDIVFTLTGKSEYNSAKEFLLHFARTENNQYSYQNCWIAELDSEVVACINIYDGARLKELRQPVIDYLQREMNRTFDHEEETQAGEYYIDSVGVRLDFQGKAIGTNLLLYVIDEFVNKCHLTLGLLVEQENTIAKRLYERVGFKKVASRILFGKKMDHLQISGKLPTTIHLLEDNTVKTV